MSTALFEDLGDGIYCIDALYTAPEFACCYLVSGGDEYALIETGTSRSVDNILATLDSLGIERTQIRYIIPTHVHLDHAGGAGTLLNLCPNADLLIHPRGLRHLVNPERLIASATEVYGEKVFRELHGEVEAADPERSHALENGARIRFGDRELEVMHTRGHADHHACYFDAQSNGWFTGDMFGISYRRQRHESGSFVMPATTPTQFEPDLYRQSVEALAARAPQRMYLTHYGALDFSPAQVDLLKQQLEDYAELGRSEATDLAAVEKGVQAITCKALERLVTNEEASHGVAMLSVDTRLNAQGIAWWGRQQS